MKQAITEISKTSEDFQSLDIQWAISSWEILLTRTQVGIITRILKQMGWGMVKENFLNWLRHTKKLSFLKFHHH